MGISIDVIDVPSFPCHVRVTLKCDGGSMIFCRGATTYVHKNGYVGSHALAMKEGWLEHNGPNGCLWLCPECSVWNRPGRAN